MLLITVEKKKQYKVSLDMKDRVILWQRVDKDSSVYRIKTSKNRLVCEVDLIVDDIWITNL